MNIKELYNQLRSMLGIDEIDFDRKVLKGIREALNDFCSNCDNPAIWCYGKHTRMLMTDFMNELKKVKVIIEQNKNIESSGFNIIEPSEIMNHDVDGIIISSFIHRNEIKKQILGLNSDAKYLDIYDYLEDEGIILMSDYFTNSHPYGKYMRLNSLQRTLNEKHNKSERRDIFFEIIKRYVSIKDFKQAIKYTKEMLSLSEDDYVKTVLEKLKTISFMQNEIISRIDSNNVLMLCIDGLRRKDVQNEKMPCLSKWLRDNTLFFLNAYSVSTSTYESLIPVYCENNDMRDRYYEMNYIDADKCRFISKAFEQNRKVFFYTDSDEFVRDKRIKRSETCQTITEKIWGITNDLFEEDNCLIYLHILYESHYSYPNPYSSDTIIADGTNIMFDFIGAKSGKLRTNYVKQQSDALRYIDDTLVPFLENIQCRTVIFADHGNVIINNDETLGDIESSKFSYHNDLLQIPLAIMSPEINVKENNQLISLFELNQIVCDLLESRAFTYCKKKYIKVQRSEIYNPDFRFLYNKYGQNQELNAFEMFIFCDDYRLVVYANNQMKLMYDNEEVDDKELIARYLEIAREDITVCEL